MKMKILAFAVLTRTNSNAFKIFRELQMEVQTITTEGGADGSFTLAFGALDYPLPGTVDVVNGEDYIVTSQDLTPYIKRGDRVSVDGWEYAVHAFRPFNATHLSLAKVPYSTCGHHGYAIVLEYPGDGRE